MYFCGDICAADSIGKVPSTRTGKLFYGEGKVLTKKMNCERYLFYKSSPVTSTVLVCVCAYCTAVRDSALRLRKEFQKTLSLRIGAFHAASNRKAVCLPDNSAVHTPAVATNIFKQYAYTVRARWGPCHHALARPRVVDGGTASSMEGSCEYIE
jgi:hypothetical protein